MYENYWNLREKPFRNLMDKNFFFYAETYEESYLRLLYNVTESQGLFTLVGETGCGKSYLCKVFMQDMLEQGYQVAYLHNPIFSAEEFLQQILFEFGIEAGNKSKTEFLQQIKKMGISQGNKTSILIIDEAHLIQDVKVLEEVRMLLNFELNNRFFITPILVGKPQLSTNIAKTPLVERISAQYQITPLSCKETGEYIYYRMKKAGCVREEIFTADAIKEIYATIGGNPREINRICDLALLLGFGENAIVIDPILVGKAIQEIQAEKPKLNCVV